MLSRLKAALSPLANKISRKTKSSHVGNRRGVALVMAITSVALLTYLAMEVMYDSTVEYTVNAQGINRLKAYYAARSGMELSLLRVKIYQSITNKFTPEQLGSFQTYIDEVWRFPFVWPLQLPSQLNEMDKESAQNLVKESSMDASFSTSIQDEGSRLDLNDLVSPSKTLRELTKKRLLEVFERKSKDDDKWREKYGSVRFDELINNITDWMSDKNASTNGGDKRGGYTDLNKDSGGGYPPNRGFRTLQELRMVAGMNDDFYDLLAPQITIYGMRGVNPNVASKDILMSLDPGITTEVADKIIARRNDQNKGGPFKADKEFWDFVTGEGGARLETQEPEKIPLSFETLLSFRIKSTGEYGGALREIEVVTMDLDRTAKRIKKFVDDDKKKDEGKEEGGKPPAPKPDPKPNALPKGPPRIVYWTER